MGILRSAAAGLDFQHTGVYGSSFKRSLSVAIALFGSIRFC